MNLTPEELDEFEERTAILVHDSGMPLERAEEEAIKIVMAKRERNKKQAESMECD